MRILKWAMTCMALTLAGCAVNLSKVKYDEERTAANSRFGTLKVEQSVCEVERQLALYTDDTRQLWLLCPYRYEGRTVPLVAYIGPDPKKPPVEFTHDAAVTKTKSLKKEALRPCGTNRYCVNLDAYGYMDFSIQWAANKALIRYTDLSGGLKDLDTFYEQLDGRATTSPLDPELVKLVKFTSVAERVERLATLEQLRNVTTQLRAVGLQDSGPIRPALERRRVALETEEFRRQGTFAGFQSAYALTKDAADLGSWAACCRRTSPACT